MEKILYNMLIIAIYKEAYVKNQVKLVKVLNGYKDVLIYSIQQTKDWKKKKKSKMRMSLVSKTQNIIEIYQKKGESMGKIREF